MTIRRGDTRRFSRPRSWDVRTPHRIRRESRAEPAALPVPHPGRWRLVTVAIGVAILAMLFAAGNRELTDRTVTGRAAGTVVRIFEGLATYTHGCTGRCPQNWQRLVLWSLVVAGVLAWRAWWQSRLAHLPGPVTVQEFIVGTVAGDGGTGAGPPARAGGAEAVGTGTGPAGAGGGAGAGGPVEGSAGGGGPGGSAGAGSAGGSVSGGGGAGSGPRAGDGDTVPANPADIRAHFCRQLSETRIYPPYAGPSDPPPQSFLDVLGRTDGTTWNPVQLALRALPALRPRIGYLVTGTLQTRKQTPRYGITVTVTSLLGGSAITTAWGEDWIEASSRSAYWVLATILPVTRLAGAPPWRRWRGRALPAALFEAYNEGKRRQDAGQLDEALHWYATALRHDPFNADLRLMVASVQEELGLFLDALDTYQGALAVGELSDRYTGHLWSHKRRRLCHPFRHAVALLRYLRRRPESIRLRYQYATTLAYAERTLTEWYADDAAGERRRLRAQQKQRLTQALVARYWPVALSFADQPDEESARHWLEEVLSDPAHAAAARVVCQLAAAQEVYRLHEDLAATWLLRRLRSEITRTVLRLARDVWAPLRLARAVHDWRVSDWRPSRAATGDGGQGTPTPTFDPTGSLAGWWIWSRRRRAAEIVRSWPPTVEQLDRAISRAQRRWLPWPHLGYLDYYNAACTYAFALHACPDGAADPLATALTERATEQLRASLACTESAVAARLRAWMVSSDPDLARLRNQPAFRYLERDEFPMFKLIYPRPQRVTDIRAAAYAKELIRTGALLLERQWRRRGATVMDHDQLIDWLELDERTWTVLRRIAVDLAGYWRDRVEFIQLVRAAVGPVQAAQMNFPPAVPAFDDLLLGAADDLAGTSIGPVPASTPVASPGAGAGLSAPSADPATGAPTATARGSVPDSSPPLAAAAPVADGAADTSAADAGSAEGPEPGGGTSPRKRATIRPGAGAQADPGSGGPTAGRQPPADPGMVAENRVRTGSAPAGREAERHDASDQLVEQVVWEHIAQVYDRLRQLEMELTDDGSDASRSARAGLAAPDMSVGAVPASGPHPICSRAAERWQRVAVRMAEAAIHVNSTNAPAFTSHRPLQSDS